VYSDQSGSRRGRLLISLVFSSVRWRELTVPRTRFLVTIALTCFLATTVVGQERAPSRVALVIGNGAYKEAPLRNPVNDARSMRKRLSALGFDVIAVENADRNAMQKAVLDFTSRLKSESTGLFFYAGHGIQSRGRNYMLPVDAKVEGERELRFEALDVQTVLEELEFAGNRMNIVILDACRNNPFERRFRGGSRGLAAIDAARGTLIAYATAPGAVAADGDGNNGLYTAELLTALSVPDLQVEEVFKRVRVAVTGHTNGAQVPWESSSLTGDFVFNHSETAAVGAAPPLTSSSHEALFWETIKDSKNSEDYRAYLQQFPQGTFAGLALIRLSDLEKSTRQEKPRGTDDGSLRVALLPFNGWHRGGYLPKMLNNMERGVTNVILHHPRLQLVYAYDHDGARDPRIGDADDYWEGSVVGKTPKRKEILAAGRELDVDVVFTYFAKRTLNEVYVAAYLFDIRNGKTMKLDVTTSLENRGQAKDLTRQLVMELLSSG
jgi:hypothetical protein